MILAIATLVVVFLVGFYTWADRKGQAYKKKHLALLGASVFSVVTFASILEGVVSGQGFSDLNRAVYAWAGSVYFPAFADAMLTLTQAADPLFVLLTSIFLIAILLMRRSWYGIILSLCALLSGAGLQWVIKYVTDIDRPTGSLVSTLYTSFPSGHATMITVFAFLLAWTFRGCFKGSVARVIFYSLISLLVIAVGFSRIYLGAHWFTDVVAGIALGIFVVSFWIIVLRGIMWNHPKLLRFFRRGENPFL